MKKPEKLLAPPRHHREHIQLEALEAAIYARDYAAAGAALMEAFRRLRTSSEFVGMQDLEEARLPYFTRLAAAILALLSDPDFNMSDEGFSMMQMQHGTISGVLSVSAFETADHMARVLAENPLETDPARFTYSVDNLSRWLLMHSLESKIDINYDDLFGRSDALAGLLFPLWAAMTNQTTVLTERSHARREMLLGLWRYFIKLEVIPDSVIAPVADVYMHCSYGVREDKHAVKAPIMRMMNEGLHRAAVPLPSEKDLRDRRLKGLATSWLRKHGKPTMVVPIEAFSSFHAMYRCYAPLMRQLGERFRLVAIARASALDATSRQLFDDVLVLPEGHLAYDKMVEQVNSQEPDIIYYPSVGMSLACMGLASVRLAPVQVFTMGHPATTASPCVDYVAAEEGMCDPELFTESIVEVPRGAIWFEPRADLPARAAKLHSFKDRCNVAIPSMVTKLNVPFLKALRRINDLVVEAGGDAPRYHFFPSQLGLGHWHAKKLLRQWFPDCKVYMRSDYVWYMGKLGTCDLALVPFPFGGTNSTVDTLWLSIPTVTLKGAQPHSRFDALILERLLPGKMGVTSTEEDYCKAAARLVLDSAARQHLSDEMFGMDMEAWLFKPPLGCGQAAGDAFWHLFTNHEKISQKVTTYKEIEDGQ